jgi:hypothetical protein
MGYTSARKRTSRNIIRVLILLFGGIASVHGRIVIHEENGWISAVEFEEDIFFTALDFLASAGSYSFVIKDAYADDTFLPHENVPYLISTNPNAPQLDLNGRERSAKSHPSITRENTTIRGDTYGPKDLRISFTFAQPPTEVFPGESLKIEAGTIPVTDGLLIPFPTSLPSLTSGYLVGFDFQPVPGESYWIPTPTIISDSISIEVIPEPSSTLILSMIALALHSIKKAQVLPRKKRSVDSSTMF